MIKQQNGEVRYFNNCAVGKKKKRINVKEGEGAETREFKKMYLYVQEDGI